MRDWPARFWAKVTKSEGCWVWTGSTSAPGWHGRVSIGPRMVMAHRVSWELANGPIPEGLFVLHHCDNPPCVRPDHLFLGTLKDNTADSRAKGRRKHIGERRPEMLSAMGKLGAAAMHAKYRGATTVRGREVYLEQVRSGQRLANRAKFRPEEVREIRGLMAAGVSPTQLGRRLGVSPSTLYRIADGKVYAHVAPSTLLENVRLLNRRAK